MALLLHALIPIRGIENSMSRLRGKLDRELIDKIVFKLLHNTINVVKNFGIKPIILTSNGSVSLLEKLGVPILLDDGSSLNKAVKSAIQKIEDEVVMLIMPDLPGLNSEVLNKFLHVHNLHVNVIAPTHDMGTAIAVLPRELYSEGFLGENSANKFIQKCNQDRIPISVIETLDIAYDLDTLDDWEQWEDFIRLKFLSE